MKIITQAMIEDVADGRSIPAQEKLAFRVVMMAGSGLKPAQKRRLGYIVQAICHAITGDFKR
jgi:hypothetical protein